MQMTNCTTAYQPALPWQAPLWLPGARHAEALFFASPEEPGAKDAGYRDLALAVLQRAYLDATGRNKRRAAEARAWLADDGLLWFASVGIGVQPGKMRAWINAGCPSGRAWSAKIDFENDDSNKQFELESEA